MDELNIPFKYFLTDTKKKLNFLDVIELCWKYYYQQYSSSVFHDENALFDI